MQSLTHEDLQKRKAELQTALQQVLEEAQRLSGAIQLCDALITEMDAQDDNKENMK